MSIARARLAASSRAREWAQRGWALAGGVSIRAKILGIVLALTMVLGLGITWEVRMVMAQVLIDELEARGHSVVSDLASRSADPILLNDTFALYQLLTETVANHPDLRYAFVVDERGHVLAHTFGDAGFPTALLALNEPGADGASRHRLYASNEGYVHDFAAPILDGRVGVVRVGLSEARLRGVINVVTGQLLLTTVLVGMAGIAAAMALTWLLTRPILALVETTRRVGAGDLSARAPHWANDEIGALADAFNQMVADLDASREAIREKEAARTRLLQRLINAQEDERRRIARELHDGVGQMLTSLMVGLKLVEQAEAPRTVRDRAADLRQVANETLDQVRVLGRELRPSLLDDLGLAAALQRYAAECERLYPSLVVDLHCDLPGRLSPPVETALYRIVQEAITNAARHSRARTISVVVRRRESQIQAIIEDDGCGFDPRSARQRADSVGIHAMTERAELLGGHLAIESNADGTTVYVEVPL